MDLNKIIERKDSAAQYMVDEITYICKNLDKRSPGSEGEKQACEYMAKVLREDCGCDRVQVEAFKENPGSFFGWIYFTITAALWRLPATSFSRLPRLFFYWEAFSFALCNLVCIKAS